MLKTDLPDYVELDENTRPQDDFYTYACSRWLAANPLPATKEKWGAFDALRERVEEQLRQILQDWQAAGTKLTADEQQVITYYRSLLSKDDHQANSLASLKRGKQAIEAAARDANLPVLLAELFKLRQKVFFRLSVAIDYKDSGRFCLALAPSGLDLLNRDYYLSNNKKIKAIRQGYLDFLEDFESRLSTLGLGYGLRPAEILEIETALAKLNWPLSKARDRIKTYNPYDWAAFNKAFQFDWTAYFKTAGVSIEKDIVVTQPSYLKGVLRYLGELPLPKLRGYLIYKFMLKHSELLNEEMAGVCFDFFDKILGGIKEIKPLEERAAATVNEVFCDVIGQAYARRHFPAAYKRKVESLTDDVCQAFLKRLEKNSWMSAASRKFAQQKLSKIVVNIGYSGFWTDYGRLDLREDNPVANALRTGEMRRRINFDLLRQKPNRRRLSVLDEKAQIVNAWTYPNLLNTSYPAAILQPPFYDHEASFAYNLGALCSIIGHELTHNFDDQGALHDQDGNLNPWLTEKERQAFKAAADKLIKKASAHEPVPGIKMKGKQVIGELIADLGGLEIIMDVIRAKYKDKATQSAAMRTAFTAHSFLFGRHYTPEMQIIQAKSGVHPEDFFRVNGVLPHCDSFYEAFDVKEGDKMYIPPEERAKIW